MGIRRRVEQLACRMAGLQLAVAVSSGSSQWQLAVGSLPAEGRFTFLSFEF